MQRVTLVRYVVKPDQTTENEALSRAVFAELRTRTPEKMAYALFRNGPEFVHVFVNLVADDSAVLTELPSFKAYSKDITTRCETAPEVTRLGLELLDSYGLSTVTRMGRA
jgi:hypothetical protein